MNVRERFHAVMNFEKPDRLPMIEWASWWWDTLERWQGEGLPSIRDRYDLYRYFGMDLYHQAWIYRDRPGMPQPSHHGAGVVANEADYEKALPYLYPAMKEDIVFNREQWKTWTAIQEKGECVNWITLEGFFWIPRLLMGIEPHLYAFYDQTELMHRINRDVAEWHLKTIDEICAIGTPDFMTFAEDMSYNNGPMISEEVFDEFLLPYYHMVVPELKRRGIRVIIDSDGDITRAVPWFERAGIEGILPLERQAGVDLAVIRRNHPAMCFIGHFDKMVMPKGEAAMRAEFERLLPLMRSGGFIPSVDHQTPPGVSYENYRIYLALLQEYIHV